MDLQHSFTVPADVDRAWSTLMDIEGVAGCFPGATITGVDGDHFDGTVKVKLGPIAMQYAGSGHFVSRDDAAHHAVLEAKGKDRRGNGTAGATVTMSLTPQGDSTKVDVATDLKVTGKPAQFGRGVIQDVSDKLLQQFVACLEQRLSAPAADSPAAPAASTPAPESATSQLSASQLSASELSTPAPSSAPSASQVAGAPPQAPPQPAPSPVDDSVDLGALVVPSLLKSYVPQLLSAAVGVILGFVLARRRHSGHG